MFEYFPGNYVWNLGVVAALNSGGLIDEVDRACRPIREAAAHGEDAGTPDFLRAWRALTDQLVDQAETAEKAGHELTAGQLYFRAANYLCQAERMLSNADPQRIPTYRRVLELAQKSFDLRDPRVSRVAVPYEGTTLPAYFSAAPATDDGPAPVIVLVNGLDSTKEHMYSSNHWAELAARGLSCLMLDQPGTGEALRLQGLTARIDTEAWAGAAVDFLQARDDVDASRIGIVGWSLGGYYAPRAAAFEKRFALVVAWGANHDWGAVQRRRLEREGSGRSRTTGSTCCGSGGTPTSTSSSASPTTSTSTESWSRSPFPSSSPTARTTVRSRLPMPIAPTTRRPTAPNASCGSSPHRRGPQSTSGSTTCPTSAPSSPTGSRTPSPR